MSEEFSIGNIIPLSYKFIYFDLDDTLLDHQSAEQSGLRDVYQQFSLFGDTDLQALTDVYHDVNRTQWGLYSRGDISRDTLERNRFEKTLRKLGLDESQHEEIGQYYVQCYRNYWQWIDGAKEGYYQIEKKYPVGILTNGFAETQRKKFEAFDLYNSAQVTVISEEIGALKPDPKVFAYATEKAGVAVNDILHVGDSFSSDIEGGSGFGWDTAWFIRNGESEKHNKAEFVFSNFNDLIAFLEV